MRHSKVIWVLSAAVLAGWGTAAQATDNRYLFASQSDFGAKHGFYVDLENSAPGQSPCQLKNAKLILGVADGSRWEFASPTVPWQTNHAYTAVATFGPQGGTLTLDGGTPVAVTTVLQADKSPLLSHQIPDWASGAADYRVEETKLTVKATGPHGSAALAQSWSANDGPESGLALLAGAPSGGMTTDFTIPPRSTVTITTTFEFVPQPTDPAAYLRSISPLIDRYGQAIAAHWPSKIASDADLTDSIATETAHDQAWGLPKNRDAYGGATDAGWKLRASGYYTVTQHAGKWWLITPDGNPCFYTGLDTVPDIPWGGTPITGREFLYADLPPHDGLYAAAWGTNGWGEGGHHDYVNFVDANLIRKYGADWQNKTDKSAAARIPEWGFSGLGKWSSGPSGAFATTPSIPVLSRHDVPNLVDHPDIFDPAVQTQFRDSLRKQITPQIHSPWVVAWSLGNEYDEIIKPEEIKAILKMPATVPARQALFAQALSGLYHGDAAAMQAAWHTNADGTAPQPSDSDIEALRQFYESRYDSFIYKTVKAIDPNHLYAGYWLSIGWWVGPQEWSILAPNCDIIGYDRYAPDFADKSFQTLIDAANKPILCGEFSYPPFYNGSRGYGKYGVIANDDADAGRLYARWVATAAAEPDCVGTCWFEYRDEPLTGRGPGDGIQPTLGEHFAFGLVDDADQPKWDLVSAVRTANLAAVTERLKSREHL